MRKTCRKVLLTICTATFAVVFGLLGALFGVENATPSALAETTESNVTTYGADLWTNDSANGSAITFTTGTDEVYGEYAELTHTASWANFYANSADSNDALKNKTLVWYVYNPLDSDLTVTYAYCNGSHSDNIFNGNSNHYTLTAKTWTQVAYAWGDKGDGTQLNHYRFVVGEKAGTTTTITGLKITATYVADSAAEVQAIIDARLAEKAAEAAKTVISEIDALPDAADFAHIEEIKTVYGHYDALSEEQKAFVTNSAKLLELYNAVKDITAYGADKWTNDNSCGSVITFTTGTDEVYGEYAELTHTESWANFYANVTENPTGKTVVWYIYNPKETDLTITLGFLNSTQYDSIFNTPNGYHYTLTAGAWTKVSIEWGANEYTQKWNVCMYRFVVGEKAGDGTNITGMKVSATYVADSAQTVQNIVTNLQSSELKTQAAAVNALIAALPQTATLTSIEQIKTAYASYSALSEAAKGYVENTDKLTSLYNAVKDITPYNTELVHGKQNGNPDYANMSFTTGTDEVYGAYTEITHTSDWGNFTVNCAQSPKGKVAVWYVYNPNGEMQFSYGTAQTVYNHDDSRTRTLAANAWTQVAIEWSESYNISSLIFVFGEKAGDYTSMTGMKVSATYIADSAESVAALLPKQNAKVGVTEAKASTYGNDWLSLFLSSSDYSGLSADHDTHLTGSNTGDHMLFSADGSTWAAKSTIDTSERFSYDTTNKTLNVWCGTSINVTTYPYIKILKGTLLPTAATLQNSESAEYYETSAEVILHLVDGVYRVYTAPVANTITGVKLSANLGDGWLTITLSDASYEATGTETITPKYTNIRTSVLFSADGNTWVENACYDGVWLARDGNELHLRVGDNFKTTYKYIKFSAGTLLPTSAAFDAPNPESCYTISEEIVFYSADGGNTFAEYVPSTDPIVRATMVSGVLNTNYGYVAFTLSNHDYASAATNDNLINHYNGTISTRLKELNFYNKIKVTYTNGSTATLDCESASGQQYLVNFGDNGGFAFMTAINQNNNALYGVASITIEKGCQFPCYEYIVNGGERAIYYETTEDVTFVSTNNLAFGKLTVHETTVEGVLDTNYGYVAFTLSNHDYASAAKDENLINHYNGNISTRLKELNFYNKIKVTFTDGSTATLDCENASGQQYLVNFGENGGFAFRTTLYEEEVTSLKNVASITIEKGCQFPCYDYIVNGDSPAYYETTKAAVFVYNGSSFVRGTSFTEVSINIGNSLALNFYATLWNAANSEAYFVATCGEYSRRYELTDKNVSVQGDVLKLTYTNIAPQNIRDDVTVVLYDKDGGELARLTYSVWQYCTKIIETSSNDKMVALAKDVLAYGGALQDYLNESTTETDIDVDGDGNAIVGTTYDASKVTSVTNKTTEEGADTTYYRFRAVGVRMDNCNALYFRYFVADGKAAQVYVNGKDYTNEAKFVENVEGGKLYVVYVWDVSPMQFATVYTAQLFGCEDTSADDPAYALVETVSYSIHSFIKSKENDTQLGALAKALYGYGAATKNYFVNTEVDLVYENTYSEPEEIAYHTISSTGDLNLAIGTDNYVSMSFNTNDTQSHPAVVGTIYYKAEGTSNLYSEAFYIAEGEKTFSMFLDVYRNGATASAIQSASKTIVRITFNNVDKNGNDGYFTLASVGHSAKSLYAEANNDDHVIYMTNGTVTVGMDLDLGGAVTYLSKTGINEYRIYTNRLKTKSVPYIGTEPAKSPSYNSSYGYKLVSSGDVNLINIHDTGREIQQSYYAGVAKGTVENKTVTNGESQKYYNASTGETSDYGARYGTQDGKVMQYNPVQSGGVDNYESQIVDYSVTKDSSGNIIKVYIKTRAQEWGSGTNIYENVLSWSYMENWYEFKNGMIYVDNNFIDWKGFLGIYENLDGAIGQETPAIYMVSSLGTYYAETAQYGTIKNSNLGDMSTATYTSGTDTSGEKHYAIQNDSTMKWHAWLNNEDFGVGIYMPKGENSSVYYFAAKGGSENTRGTVLNCKDDAYCYSSCAVVADFAEQTALRYTYVLCVDSLTNIQNNLNGISDVNNDGLGAWTTRG